MRYPTRSGAGAGIGEGWRRHANFGRALAIADRVLAADPRTAARPRSVATRSPSGACWTGAGRRRGEGSSRARARARAAPAPVDAARAQQRLDGAHALRHAGAARRRARTGDRDPARLRVAGGGGVETHAGVPHHRLPPARVEPRSTSNCAVPGGQRARRRARRPAVLHPASDYLNALVALELGRRYGLPVVVRGPWLPGDGARTLAGSRARAREGALARRTVEAACWRSADRVVTLARGDARPHRRPRRRPRADRRDPERGRRRALPAGRARRGSAGAARAAGRGAGARLRDEPVPLEGLPTLLAAAATLTSAGPSRARAARRRRASSALTCASSHGAWASLTASCWPVGSLMTTWPRTTR